LVGVGRGPCKINVNEFIGNREVAHQPSEPSDGFLLCALWLRMAFKTTLVWSLPHLEHSMI
jgi:hypothetical protein